jgi:hypothetical protein
MKDSNITDPLCLSLELLTRNPTNLYQYYTMFYNFLNPLLPKNKGLLRIFKNKIFF